MAGPLAQRVRAKYPDAYTDMTDEQLEQAVTAKYPGVYDDLLAEDTPEPQAQTPSMASLGGTVAKTALKDIFVAPFEMAGGLIKNSMERGKAAGEAFNRGDYGTAISESVQSLPPVAMTRAMVVDPARDQFAKAGVAAREPLTASSLGRTLGHGAAGIVPMVGPMAAGMTEQVMSGDPTQQAEAAGHALALLAGPKIIGKTAGGIATVAGKTARTVSGGARGAYQGYQEGGVGGGIVQGMGGAFRGAVDPLEPIPLMVKALKPRNTKIKFEDTLETALPQVNRIVQETGRPITNTAEFMEAVTAAKKAVRAEYDAIQGPRRDIGSTVDGTPIADAMVESIPKKLRLEDPAAARKIVELANVYRQPFKLTDMEVLLQDANAQLAGFYDKFPMARNREAQFNPEIAHVLAQAEEMRTAIYKVLDDPTQSAMARDLNRQYGALMEVENTAQRRGVVAKRQQPESLSEQVGQVRAAADIARGLWKLGHGNPMGAADVAAGVAGRSMGKFLKDQQTMDALIRRGMAKYTKVARAVEIPPQPPIAGLLPPAVTRLGPIPEVSGPSSVRGEYGAKWTPPPPIVRKPLGPNEPFDPVTEVRQMVSAPPPAPVAVAPSVQAAPAPVTPPPAPVAPVTPQLPPPLPAAAYTKAPTPRARLRETMSKPLPEKPPKAYKGTYYYGTRESAERALKGTDWPNGRIVEYERGYAVQKEGGGTYLGPQENGLTKAAPATSTAKPESLHSNAVARERVRQQMAGYDPPKAPATGTAPAPVVVTPTQPKAPIAVPEVAAAKVLRQIDHVIDVRGSKSASELQARVMSGLAKQVAQAQKAAGFTTVKYVPLGRSIHSVITDGEGPSLVMRQERSMKSAKAAMMEVATEASRANGAGKLTVRIPGDGVFTIENNPYAIKELMERIRKGGRGMFEDWRTLAKAKD